jgi:hypothetical protein
MFYARSRQPGLLDVKQVRIAAFNAQPGCPLFS